MPVDDVATSPEFRVKVIGEDAMVELGECLGEAAKTAIADGLVVYLEGDLGAGKTTLSRGVLRRFGHRGAVKSPTYTLVEPYELSVGCVYHFDLYRLGDPEELEYIGIRDYFGPGRLCLVEWPARGKGYMPAADLHIGVTVSGSGRLVRINAEGSRGFGVIDAIKVIASQYSFS